jgi:hypothetical protein
VRCDDLRPTAATKTTTTTNNTSERRERERERERVKARGETMGAHKGFRFWALAPVQSPFHTSSCSAGGSYCMYFYLGYTYINTYIRIARVKLQHAPTNQRRTIHWVDGWMDGRYDSVVVDEEPQL